jgi:K+-transporting ATPase ATPase C chain
MADPITRPRPDPTAASAPESNDRQPSPAGPLLAELRTAAAATMFFAFLVCGVYPVAVWALAQGLFPREADGSLIYRHGEPVGSELIAQGFTAPHYFHPRPSAAGEAGYDASGSSATNLGPLSEKLLGTVKERVAAYRAQNGLPADCPVPADAVTASASGLDPHIGLANVLLQAPRVAAARGMDARLMIAIVREHVEGRDFGVLGEPRVNVLKLNLALDKKR